MLAKGSQNIRKRSKYKTNRVKDSRGRADKGMPRLETESTPPVKVHAISDLCFMLTGDGLFPRKRTGKVKLEETATKARKSSLSQARL